MSETTVRAAIGVTETNPVSPEKIGGNKRVINPPRPKKRLTRFSAVPDRLAHIADQGIRAGNHDASAHAKQKQQEDDAAKAGGRGRAKRAMRITQDRGSVRASRLRYRAAGPRQETRRSIRAPARKRWCRSGGRQAEAVGKIGQDSAQHGGDHSVDKDRDNRGENQHAAKPTSFL